MDPGAGEDSLIPVGRVGAPHGVRGWIRVDSSARPPESILEFREWWLGPAGSERPYELASGRMQGERVVASLAGVDDRDAAAELRHAVISVPRQQLPPLAENEWYWADLIGLEVQTPDGVVLGSVIDLLETGANDVLVVRGERERLIPWVPDQFVVSVDRGQGVMTVHWDPEF